MPFDVRRKGFVADINVTPFVDVMLVLLVIFMVTAPLMTQGVEVDLPQTKTVETLPEDSDHLMLTVKKNGNIFLDEYAVKREDLGRQLKRLVTEEGKLLYLRADKEAAYGLVVEIMAEVKEAGISRLGVVAEPEEE